MKGFDPRIDQYIGRSAPFAIPILQYLRETIHRVCPDVTETIKWSFPHFLYQGQILCSMASFKSHVAFGFWKAAAMKDADQLLNPVGDTAMGHFGRIRSLSDIPVPEVLESYIREAMVLNETGAKVRLTKNGKPRPAPEMPSDFAEAMDNQPSARAFFQSLSTSQQREYIEWILEARTTPTRKKRIGTAVEWLSEGKKHNWKYQRE